MNTTTGNSCKLFVGEISDISTEDDLIHIFSPCGLLTDVSIDRRVDSYGNCLCHGFVTFSNRMESYTAMRMLNGETLHNRRLRIRWAAQVPLPIGAPPSQKRGGAAVINSVYIYYTSPETAFYLSEADLWPVFELFGNVTEISIKQSKMDPNNYRQTGYGFVHFSSNEAGVASALRTVQELNGETVHGMRFTVEPSKNLLKQFQKFQAGRGNGAGPGAAVGTGAGVRSNSGHGMRAGSAWNGNASTRSSHAPHSLHSCSSSSSSSSSSVTSSSSSSFPPSYFPPSFSSTSSYSTFSSSHSAAAGRVRGGGGERGAMLFTGGGGGSGSREGGRGYNISHSIYPQSQEQRYVGGRAYPAAGSSASGGGAFSHSFQDTPAAVASSFGFRNYPEGPPVMGLRAAGAGSGAAGTEVSAQPHKYSLSAGRGFPPQGGYAHAQEEVHMRQASAGSGPQQMVYGRTGFVGSISNNSTNPPATPSSSHPTQASSAVSRLPVTVTSTTTAAVATAAMGWENQQAKGSHERYELRQLKEEGHEPPMGAPPYPVHDDVHGKPLRGASLPLRKDDYYHHSYTCEEVPPAVPEYYPSASTLTSAPNIRFSPRMYAEEGLYRLHHHEQQQDFEFAEVAAGCNDGNRGGRRVVGGGETRAVEQLETEWKSSRTSSDSSASTPVARIGSTAGPPHSWSLGSTNVHGEDGRQKTGGLLSESPVGVGGGAPHLYDARNHRQALASLPLQGRERERQGGRLNEDGAFSSSLERGLLRVRTIQTQQQQFQERAGRRVNPPVGDLMQRKEESDGLSGSAFSFVDASQESVPNRADFTAQWHVYENYDGNYDKDEGDTRRDVDGSDFAMNNLCQDIASSVILSPRG